MLTALVAAGCGDAILCDSSPLVVIQAPTATIGVDRDAVAPGVQTDVRVRSTLLPTDGLELTVLDSAGAVVATHRGLAGEGGTTLFEGVTVPGPRAKLVAIGRSECGVSEDSIEIDVTAGTGCDLQITPAPVAVAAYPVGVLNSQIDPDPEAPGFQAAVAVATRSGWNVELYGNRGDGEQMLGQGLADAVGVVRFPQPLPDGPVSYRAVCRGEGGEAIPSTTASAHVDTTPPTCDFTSPLPGSTITPSHDLDGDLGNGVQLSLEAVVGGGDTAGESVQLMITSDSAQTMFPMSPVDAQGRTRAVVTLDPEETPATFQLSIASNDRAANPCTSTHAYEVVYEGCSIEVLSPVSPVTADADGIASNGAQVDVVLSVGAACEGQTVTATCGSGTPQGVVPPGGQVTLRTTLCGGSPCEAQEMCTFRVSSPAGVQTQTTAPISIDNLGPVVTVAVVEPPLACGAQLTPASDIDPATEGVQVTARVTAASGAVNPAIEITSAGGTTSTPAPTDVAITLAPGLNVLTGVAFDLLGTRGQSAACTVTLADIALTFAPPAADGMLARRDGTVSGNALTAPLCGTVSHSGAAVSVRINGGPSLPATVTGNDWCRTISLAEASSHAVFVTATKNASFGTAALSLGVDLTPPPAVTAPAAFTTTRRLARVEWTAPADGAGPVAGYIVRASTTPITEAGFDTQGIVIATGAPQTPGAREVAALATARAGVPHWFGIASVDLAGNRAPAVVVGPIVPAFVQQGPTGGPNPGQGDLAMGAAIAHGKFNNDDYDDLAIAAPTQNAGGFAKSGAVYVYFGGPAGIDTMPSLSILGTSVDALTGSGLAAVRWSSATRDDLVVGAPGAAGGAGRLFVFAGGASFPTGAVSAGSAPLQIGVSAIAPGWFANGRLGAAVVAADVDGDGVRDLVASAPRGGGTGGIVTLYGGTVTASLSLSDTDTSGFGAAIVEYLPDPLGLTGRGFGTYLHAVGPTRGPLDLDDDLVVAYEDDILTTGDSLWVIRGNGTRPTASLTQRAAITGRDVRIDLVSTFRNTEFGAQAVSISDHNGDGAADLAIAAYRNLNAAGQVLVIDGDVIGTGGVAKTTDSGVVLTTIQGTSGMRVGAVLVTRDGGSDDDVDGDGLADLLVGAVSGGVARLFVWFGGTLSPGLMSVGSAGSSIAGPSVFGFSTVQPHGPAGQARWVGDLNGDGLNDICWASPYDNATGLDGAFAVLTDALPATP